MKKFIILVMFWFGVIFVPYWTGLAACWASKTYHTDLSFFSTPNNLILTWTDGFMILMLSVIITSFFLMISLTILEIVD